jgi:hypothetical protein
MRQVNLGRDALGAAGRGACATGAVSELRANFLGFVLLKRAGVGLARCQAEFRQHVKNLAALDFQLSREIVDSNLTHPPLFRNCYPKPISRS